MSRNIQSMNYFLSVSFLILIFSFERSVGRDLMKDFREFKINEITSEKLSEMPKKDIFIYYYYYIDIIPRHENNDMEWRLVIKEDILSRGEDAQSIIEDVYDSEKSLSVKSRVLRALHTFPEVDKAPFIEKIFSEIDGYPKEIGIDGIIRNKVCEKLKFILEYGSSSDVSEVERIWKEFNVEDEFFTEDIRKAKKRIMSKRINDRSSKTSERRMKTLDDSQESGVDGESGRNSTVYSVIAFVIFTSIVLVAKNNFGKSKG